MGGDDNFETSPICTMFANKCYTRYRAVEFFCAGILGLERMIRLGVYYVSV
jgi:hypothetical protein